MAYILAWQNGEIIPTPPDFVVPGGTYVDLRKFSRHWELDAPDDEVLYRHGVYRIHFRPKPDHNPYTHRLREELVFNKEGKRFDQTWHIKDNDLSDTTIHETWTMPKHDVLWMIAWMGWEDWIDATTAYLKHKHANGDTAYPTFLNILNEPDISLKSFLEAVQIALDHSAASGATDIPKDDTNVINIWNHVWETRTSAP